MKKKILITDGVNKNSLAILRAIGSRYHIDVTSHYPKILTLCAYSRFCKKCCRIYKGIDNADTYASELISILEKEKYDVLIPVGLKSYLAVVKHRESIEKLTHLVVPEQDKMDIAYNKDKTMDFARRLGIPIPSTIIIDSAKDLKKINNFPVVIKSSDGSGVFVKYCNDENELKINFQKLIAISKTKIIAQEYITGFGCGFYAVYDKGEMVAYYMHRRITEFPITGGPSAVAESYFDPKLYEYGKRICEQLEWNGPIMIEFKHDTLKKDYTIIEINPKLWGSLDLTIEAGVNIPELLIKVALGEKTNPDAGYEDIRYRWLFPDEFWALLSDLSLKNMIGFFHMDKKTKTNFYLNDPLPFMVQFLRSVAEGLIIFVSFSRKFPHGKLIKKTKIK